MAKAILCYIQGSVSLAARQLFLRLIQRIDVREVAVLLIQIQAIADQKTVGHRVPQIVYVDRDTAS